MSHADRAWLAVAGVVLAAEITAPRGELMSEGCDRWLERRPWLTRVGITYVALHLLNVWPWWFDPLHLIAKTFGR